MLNFNVVIKILVPPVLCAILIVATKMGLDYYPLSFGLVVGIINWNNYNDKLGSYFGIVLSLIASYASFFIAVFSVSVTIEIFKIIGFSNREIMAMCIATCIIAPLILFLFYKFIFCYKIKTKFSIIIITSSVILLILAFYINNKYAGFKEKEQDFGEFFNLYASWQIIMALSIQLLIIQNIYHKGKDVNISKN